MKGVVLTNGIIRANDGNRYNFELSDVENLGDLTDLSELEVDFEPFEQRAKSICLLNQKAKIESKCEEIKQIGDFHIFRGRAKLQKDDIFSQTTGRISTSLIGGMVSGNINTKTFSKKTISIGNKYFNLQENSKYATTIADDDELVLLAHNQGQGSYNILAIENLTRNFGIETSDGFTIRRFYIFFFILKVIGLFFLCCGVIGLMISQIISRDDLVTIVSTSIFIFCVVLMYKKGNKYKTTYKFFKEYIKNLKD